MSVARLRRTFWGNLPVPPDSLHWSAARTGASRRLVGGKTV
jgi:hypothetical protein